MGSVDPATLSAFPTFTLCGLRFSGPGECHEQGSGKRGADSNGCKKKNPAIKDLLDKRGETYADRPNWPITEMCAWWCYYPSITHRVDNTWPLVRIQIGSCLLRGRV
jgi:hypothetical protein